MVLAKKKVRIQCEKSAGRERTANNAARSFKDGTRIMITRSAGLACLTLALSTQIQATGPSPMQRFALTSRAPGPDVYLYAGTEAFDAGETNVVGAPIELRVFLNDIFEIGLSSALQHGNFEGNSRTVAGDTAVRASAGFRDLLFFDFATVEVEKVVGHAPLGFSSGADYAAQIHLQDGWTRLGYDVTAAYLTYRNEPGLPDDAMRYSVGYRGQFAGLHLGLDYVTFTGDDLADSDFIDLVLMKRNHGGGSFYGLVEKGISADNDSWYVGIGYEFKLGN